MAITKVSRNLLNTGVSDSSDATAITIDSSENVLVGATSYNNDNAGVGLGSSGFLYATRDGSLAASFKRLTSTGSIADFRKDSSTIASVTSDGICFGSDSAAANALDDYEEGNWTPAYSSGTGSFTTVPYAGDSRVGRYTKIGRMVFISGKIQTSASGVVHGTAGSSLQIGGLPFSASSISNFTNSGITVTYSAFFGSSKVPFAGDCIGSIIRLRHRATGTSNAVDSSATDLSTSTGGTYNRLIFFGSYITDE